MKKIIWGIIIAVGVFLLIGIGALWYASNDYYETSAEIDSYLVNTCVEEADWYYCPGTNGEQILIMAGGKVEESAYLYLAEQLQADGYTVYVPTSFLKLSIIDSSNAREILNNSTGTWTIIGHSLGGTVGSMLYEDYPDQIESIVFLGSYPYGNIEEINTLSITGSNDLILDQSSYEAADWPDNTTFVEIDGGNHSNFGFYGHQDGDGESTLTAQKQQDIVVSEVIKFLNSF